MNGDWSRRLMFFQFQEEDTNCALQLFDLLACFEVRIKP